MHNCEDCLHRGVLPQVRIFYTLKEYIFITTIASSASGHMPSRIKNPGHVSECRVCDVVLLQCIRFLTVFSVGFERIILKLTRIYFLCFRFIEINFELKFHLKCKCLSDANKLIMEGHRPMRCCYA